MKNRRSRVHLRLYLSRYWQLYALLVLPVLCFVVFKILPMAGNIIAFRRYKLGGSIFGVEWSGLRYFKMFWSDPSFWRAFSNTIQLSLANLVFTFPVPILFALLLNEIKRHSIKKFIQTVSYLPRFFSTVVIISMMTEIFSPTTGVVNKILVSLFGMEPIYFMGEPQWFRFNYVISDMWQFTGYTAVIYFAAITGVNMELYEAAMIDGANRWQQTLYVTIPEISSTILTMLIMKIGQLMTLSFEKVLLMYNTQNSTTSDIIDTFVYRIGLTQTNYSYATAVGLFGALVGLMLVFLANMFSRRLTGESLY